MNIQHNKLIPWSGWFISISFCTSENSNGIFILYLEKKKKNLTIKLFKYLTETPLRSSNQKKNCQFGLFGFFFFFVNINVNENAF